MDRYGFHQQTTIAGRGRKTEENARKAVGEFSIDAVAVHIFDQPRMIARGIASSPGLAIDRELKITDRVPEVEEIKGLLSKRR